MDIPTVEEIKKQIGEVIDDSVYSSEALNRIIELFVQTIRKLNGEKKEQPE
jgi:hypothetical protein